MLEFTRNLSRSILSATLLLSLAACSGGGGGGGSNNSASIAGTIGFPATGGPILEAEPNDTVEQAHSLGTLVAGQTIVVAGQVSGVDAVDGFKVTAPSRVTITATLSFDAADDFDIGIFDAIAGDFVEAFATTSVPEVGTFHAQGTFFPVVAQFAGSGSYTLTLVASAPADPIVEREPNDLHGQAQYLGTIDGGQQINLSGNADSVTDANDRFLIAVPEDIDLAADLFMFGPGSNFDVIYSDATPDILAPIEIIRFNSLIANPETGTAPITALTLVEVTVLATSGLGAYDLTLSATASIAATGGTRSWSMAPSSHELRQRFARQSSQRFGAPILDSMPGELLVMPRAGRDVLPELARRGLAVEARVPNGVMKCVAQVPAGISEENSRRRTVALMASLGGLEAVEYAEPNFIRHAYGVPNDPFFNLQWHYTQIQLPAAWDITQGDNSIRVGVIDTGQTNHPDLVSRLIPGFDFISNVGIAGDGNGVDADPTDIGDGQGAQPSSFHGTHVAGTIGATTDNNSGVAGVTWFGKIMHLRVLGIGGGTDFDITQAVLYSAGLANAATTPLPQPLDVINMSLGGPGFSQTFQNACTAAKNAGVAIFAAAGNENSTVESFPAAYDNVISVAAVDFNAARAPYSNHNGEVDIAAPGGDMTKDLNGDGFGDGVLSTRADDSGNPTVFTFEFLQGTSMACPHAAGVAALMKAAALPGNLTPTQIETIMTTTATDLGTAGRDDFFGFGLVNAFQAVLQASNGTPVNPVLGLSTQALSFAPGVIAQNIQVSNLGGGTLHVGTPIVTTDSGGSWLTATRVPIAVPVSSDTSAIAVSVDRTGLPDGLFTGSISVPSDGTNGALVVQVSLQVDTSPTPTNIDIFVIAVNADTGDSVRQDIVNPTSGLAYSVASLPAGSYLIFAGSDDDNDGFICGPGDLFCGAFPTLDQPVAIDVVVGEAVPAIDFTVQSNFQGMTASPAHRKIRLE
ncbi:MAG TPA: S8 family serine peptidase [Planctomycetota bacterium]|nr:S8 family serine peptidase [Planctomycetota bacterium]